MAEIDTLIDAQDKETGVCCMLFGFVNMVIPTAIRDLARQLHANGTSLCQIAKILKKSKSTVHYLLNNDYGRVKNYKGSARKITQRDENRIKRACRSMKSDGELITSSKLQKELELECSTRTVQRKLKELGMTYKIVKQEIPLTAEQKQRRLDLASEWIDTAFPFNRVVFTDEKRFKKDGPDGQKTWMNDANCNTWPNRIKRQQGGGGVHVWGALAPNGKLFVHRLIGSVDSAKYIHVLEHHAFPWIFEEEGQEDWIFQQDNCPAHTSSQTRSWFEERSLVVLPWPSRSPDLNPIENAWGMISELVYVRGAFKSDDELWSAIQKAVVDLNTNRKQDLLNLTRSMPRRCRKVIELRGDTIDY